MTVRDRYGSFAELSQSEVQGRDYRRFVERRASAIAVIAPHGGGIEPGTSEIARAVAGREFSCYAFEGIRASGNEFLHITSTVFDDPECLEMLRGCQVAVAFHGCRGRKALVHVGGSHAELKAQLACALRSAGFDARESAEDYAGDHPRNLCNRGRSGRGVQLELSEGLRGSMFTGLDLQGRRAPTDLFENFVRAVRGALMQPAKEMHLD